MRVVGPDRFARAAGCALVLLCACSAKPRAAIEEPTRSAPPTPTPMRACRYVFPVQPPSLVHYGRSHHDYAATDILAPRGTRVVSPVDGVVDWVSRVDHWVSGVNDPATRGGLSVAVIGLDGIRYYGSHLLDVTEGIEPGIRVVAGQEIGHVDTSGNAEGTGAHLHFGVSRPTTADDWKVRRGEVSPYDVLNAWRAGRAATPDVPGARAPSCLRVH